MKKNNIVKGLLATALSSALIIGGAIVYSDAKELLDSSSFSELKNNHSKNNESKKINQSNSRNGETNFEYDFLVSGGTSSALVATIGGVQHVFMWGDNSLGQLGVGTYGESVPEEYNKTTATNIWNYSHNKQIESGEVVETWLNQTSSLPTPEDINIDGGNAGIQGRVVDIVMGDATTYAIIENEEGFIDVYATGSNVYGQLGSGNISDITSEESINPNSYYGYRPSWEKIHFYNEDATEIKFVEVLKLSANKSTYFSAIDEDGNNRVFSWGWNGTGMLGNGKNGFSREYYAANDIIDDARGGIDEIKYSVVDTPVEITNNLFLPVYSSKNEVPIDINFDWDTYMYGTRYEETSIISDFEKNYNNYWTGNQYLDEEVEILEPTYPFETTGLNSTNDWKIVDFKVGKTDTIFVAEDSFGNRTLLAAGYLFQKYPNFLLNGLKESGRNLWDIKLAVPSSSNTNGDFKNTISTVPAIYFWDGMPADKLFDVSDSETSMAVDVENEMAINYKNVDSIELIDYDLTSLTNMIALRMTENGVSTDHLFVWNWGVRASQKGPRKMGAPVNSYNGNYEFHNGDGTSYTYEGNGYLIGDTYSDSATAIFGEVNLGYNSLNSENKFVGGLPQGSEIVRLFSTTDANLVSGGALIKTPNELNSDEDIYSIIQWGSNIGYLIDPSQSVADNNEEASVVGETSAAEYGFKTTISLTTASEIGEIASNTFASEEGKFDMLKSQGRTIDQFLNEQYDPSNPDTTNSIYDQTHKYIISDVVTSGTSMSVIVKDETTGEIYQYYYGDNSSKQISSSIDSEDIKSPTSLFISSAPITDSFQINYDTVQSDGVDFSVELIHGGKMDQFNGSAENSLRVYGDVNQDGITTNDEQFGNNGTIDVNGSVRKLGNIEYIGRGTEILNGDEKSPLYNLEDISYEDQKLNTYNERYNFRISGLDAGVTYDKLNVSINGAHNVGVDGELSTLLHPKYKKSSFVVNKLQNDYVEFETELMFNVPGYGSINWPVEKSEEITEDILKQYTTITATEISSTDVETSITIDNDLNLEILEIGEPGDPDQIIADGEEPSGMKIKFRISGLNPGSTYSNITFKLDNADYVPWIDDVVLDEELIMTKDLQFVEGTASIYPEEVTEESFKFAIQIYSGEIIDTTTSSTTFYQNANLDSLVATASETSVVSGDTIENVEINTSIEAKNNGWYDITFNELSSNYTYSNIHLEISEDEASSSFHTNFTTTSINLTDIEQSTLATPYKINSMSQVDETSAGIKLFEPAADKVGFMIDVEDSNSNPEYSYFNPESDIESITFNSNKQTEYTSASFVDGTLNYHSTEMVDGNEINYYYISGMVPNEELTNLKVNLSNGESYILPETLKSNKSKLNWNNDKLDFENKTKNSIEITLYTDESTSNTENINLDTTSIELDATDINDSSDVEHIVFTKDGENSWELISSNNDSYTFKLNGFEPKDYISNIQATYTSEYYGAVSTSFIEINNTYTEGEPAEIYDDSYSVIVEPDSNSVTIDGIKIRSSIDDGSVSIVENINVSAKATSLVDPNIQWDYNYSLDAADYSVSSTDAENGYSIYSLKLNNLIPYASYSDIIVSLPNNNGISATYKGEFQTLANNLSDVYFSKSSLLISDLNIVDTENNTAKLRVDTNLGEEAIYYEQIVSDFESVEDKIFTDLGEYDSSDFGVLLSLVDSDGSAVGLGDERISSITYNYSEGYLEINLEGLDSNTKYLIKSIKFKDDGNSSKVSEPTIHQIDPEDGSEQLLELDIPPLAYAKETFSFNENSVVMDKVSIDNNGESYVGEKFSITTNPLWWGGGYEVIHPETVGKFILSNGTELDVETSYEFPPNHFVDGEPSTSQSGQLVTYSVTVPEQLIGTNLEIVAIEYGTFGYTQEIGATDDDSSTGIVSDFVEHESSPVRIELSGKRLYDGIQGEVAGSNYDNSFNVQTVKLWDYSVIGIGGSNINSITSREDELVIQLDQKDYRDIKEYTTAKWGGVTTVTINGSEYQLENITSSRTFTSASFKVVGLQVQEYTDYLITEINGIKLQTESLLSIKEYAKQHFILWFTILSIFTIGVALLIIWLLFRRTFARILSTNKVEQNTVTFVLNKSKNSKFDNEIKSRTLIGKQDEEEINFSYKLSYGKMNEILITITEIKNGVQIHDLTFIADKNKNEKLSTDYAKKLEKWNSDKEKSKINKKEFTTKKPKKPILSKDIKILGKVDTEILTPTKDDGKNVKIESLENSIKIENRDIGIKKSLIWHANKNIKLNKKDDKNLSKFVTVKEKSKNEILNSKEKISKLKNKIKEINLEKKDLKKPNSK